MMTTSPKVFSDNEIETVKFSSLFSEIEEEAVSPEDAVPLNLPDIRTLTGFSGRETDAENEVSAEELLEAAGLEARKIVEEAEKRSGDVLSAAHEKAMLEFEMKVEQATAERTEEISESFARGLAALDSLTEELSDRLKHELVGLSIAIAEKVVRETLSDKEELILGILNNALGKVNEMSIATIHLNPCDLELAETVKDEIEFKGVFEFKEDATIDRGGCLIKTSSGDIDARIDAQFEEIRNSLLNNSNA